MPHDLTYCRTCRVWRRWPCGEAMSYCPRCLEAQQVRHDVPTHVELLARLEAWRDRTPQTVLDGLARALAEAEHAFEEEDDTDEGQSAHDRLPRLSGYHG